MITVSRRRWLARLSILLLAGALFVLVEFAGLHSFALIGFTLLGGCLSVAGAYWFVRNRGVLRWSAAAMAVLAPVAVAALFASRELLWVAVAVIAILVAAVQSARAAMGLASVAPHPTERKADRPRHAFLIMNPRSGDGKVARFDLRRRAEKLGAEVVMLEGPGRVDVARLARQAVAGGADLLGVAGGDGTQALVAAVAAEHGVPYLCISAGTRNHFAMDLGLDRADPASCLTALRDGIERRVDLGQIGDRIFVNNASFGVYAEIVRSPAYRDDKRGTTLAMLPELLSEDGRRHQLHARIPGKEAIEGPQALLISNNPYELSDIAGLGRRDRLDTGRLGIIAVSVQSAAQAIGVVAAGGGSGVISLRAKEVTVDSGQAQLPVGIDGETALMPTPVRCVIRKRALRVVVPRHRPGVPAPRSELTWLKLVKLAGFGPAPVGHEGHAPYDG